MADPEGRRGDVSSSAPNTPLSADGTTTTFVTELKPTNATSDASDTISVSTSSLLATDLDLPLLTPEALATKENLAQQSMNSSGGLFSMTTASHGSPTMPALMVEMGSNSKDTSTEDDASKKQSESISSREEGHSRRTTEESRESKWESTGEKRSLIVELDEGDSGGRPEVPAPGVSPRSRDLEEYEAKDGSGLGWAVRSPQGGHYLETSGSASARKEGALELEDLEEQATSVGSSQSDQPKRYAFEKLSDVPAVRDPREIEAAEIALEKIRGKPAHELSAEERVWKLAAEGGSTLASEKVELDHESKERVKETLRKHKLTDKTTLAF